MNGSESVIMHDNNTQKYMKEISTRIEQIAGQVTTEVEQIKKEALEDATQIRKEALADAEKIKSTAEEEVRQKKEKLQEEEKQVRERLRAYWEKEQKEYRQELNQKMLHLSNDYLEETKRTEQIHDEMCESTSAVQAVFVQEMADLFSKLQETKSGFFTQLGEWQKALYSVKVKPLARCYVELYQIIHADCLLETELLGAHSSQDTVEGLQKLNHTLTTFLCSFEKSLHGLDLYVFYPEAGETFDPSLQLAEEKVEDTEKQIVECIVPGIVKKAKDENDDDVIIKPVVRVGDVKMEDRKIKLWTK